MIKQFICVLLVLLFWNCTKQDDTLIYGSGTIEATEIVVSAAATGEITWLGADEGVTVSKGDTLAILDYEKLDIQLALNDAQLKELDVSYLAAQKNREQAMLHLTNQEKKYKRISVLLEKESATQQKFDDVYTAFEIAEKQLESVATQTDIIQAKRDQMKARNRLILSQIGDAKIQSPASGVILQKYHEAGEFVTPGRALFRIADLSKVWIKIYISEVQLGRIMLNQQASLFVDSFPDQPFTGRVIWISPKAEFTPKNVQTQEARLDLVYAVKIELENKDHKLKIGMPADVEIDLSN